MTHTSKKLKLSFFVISVIVFNVESCMSRFNTRTNNRKNQKFGSGDVSVQCRDENGNSVPWFIVYKLPKLKSASGSTFRQGTGYSYILPGFNSWRPSERPIGNLNSMVGQTLQPFIDSSSDLLSLIYNDQPPDREAFTGGGHSKGIVLSKSKGGIWLMHSVPKFPITGTEFYPSNGLINGQMFLCLTLTAGQVDSIGDTFQLVRPNVGNFSIPVKLKSKFPKLEKFIASKRFSGPLNNTFPLTTGQLNFQVFAKSPRFDTEIYLDWIAPTLQSDLEVQSWLIGQGVLQSNCTAHSYKVYNINEKRVDGNAFTRNDHSKWTVTPKESQGNPWVCISDLNRMKGQRSRGGATICTSNQMVWTAFNSAVVELQPCEKLR